MLECVECSAWFDAGSYLRGCPRPGCSGLLVYRYPRGVPGTFPVGRDSSAWRFAPLLPIDRPGDAPLDLAPTPLVHSRIIGPALGLERLWLKVESVQPTRTFKDREALVAVSRFRELGVQRLVTATTGDSGAAYLRAALTAGMDLTIFVPENAATRWAEIQREVQETLPTAPRGRHRSFVSGRTFDRAIEGAETYAREHRVPFEYGFRNQLRVEGVKTLALEIIDALGGVPEVYVQAVGSGVGLFAFWKGATEWMGRSPRLYGVQPEGCNPAVRAFQGDTAPVGEPDTGVLGIANPRLPSSWAMLRRIGCRFVNGLPGGSRAEREEVRRLLRMLAREGVGDAGLEAACALSGLESLVRAGEVSSTERVVLAISGGLRRSDLEPLA